MLKPYRGAFPRIHPTAFVEESAQVIGDVEIGAHSSVWFNVVIRGDVHYIRIGERTNIQDLSMLHVTRDTHPLILGNEVSVAHSVTLHGCTIRDRCLIAMGAIVLDGAVVGEECIVGAGAVVTEGTEIPPRSLVMGIPARVKRSLTESEIAGLRRRAENYVRYAQTYRAMGEQDP